MKARKFVIPDLDLAVFGSLNFDWLLTRIFREVIPIDRVKLVSMIKAKLSPEHVFVIQARMRGCTLADVGFMTGVSRDRIRQMQEHACRKLRHPVVSRSYKIPLDYIPFEEVHDDSRS